jgi:CRP-like cAMP-binding protein/membrane protease YdiL (CAAX protease family)
MLSAGGDTTDIFVTGNLFRGLDPAARAALQPLLCEQSFASGATVIGEGDADPNVYFIRTGRVQVMKRTTDREGVHQLLVLGEGETFGEMKLAEFKPSSASIIALDPVICWSLDLRHLSHPDLIATRAQLVTNLATLLAERLRRNSETTVDSMQNELEQARARESAGKFNLNVVALLSLYSFCVAGFFQIDPMKRPNQGIVSAVAILIGAVPIWRMIKKSPYPPSAYGLTWLKWRAVAAEAVLYTSPFLLLMTVIKALCIHFIPRLHAEPLFNPSAIFGGGPFRPGFFIFSVLLYATLTPAQELFNRSGLQASMQKFLPSTPGRTNWTPIVFSNLVFATAHTHIGFGFALSAFLPGLFWGWLFDKQRSLVGVAVSHTLVGVWALFVIGIQAVVGGM